MSSRAKSQTSQNWYADLPAVWNPPTTDADRKQLTRHLIEQVRVTVLGTSEKVDVEIAWAGRHRTRAQITRPWPA